MPTPPSHPDSRDTPDGAASTSRRSSFGAGYARQHSFAGLRLLKPNRRMAIATAVLVVCTLAGTAITEGVRLLAGVSANPASDAARMATTHTPSPSASPSGTHRPSSMPSAPNAGSSVPAAQAPPPAAPPAQQQPPPPVTVTGAPTKQSTTQPVTFKGAVLTNFGSNRCLASQGGSERSGTQLVLADCSTSDPSQGWTFAADGTLRDFGGRMCIDDNNGTPQNGTPLILATCNPKGRSTQAFVLKATYDLVEVQPDLCVDAKDNGTSAGTVLQLWQCIGAANQKWKMS